MHINARQLEMRKPRKLVTGGDLRFLTVALSSLPPGRAVFASRKSLKNANNRICLIPVIRGKVPLSEFYGVFIMNVSLTPELAKFVEKEVESGLYQTASEVVRAGLRRLKEDKTARLPQAPRTLEELERQLAQSIDRLDRGEGVDGEGVFRRLRKRIKESRSDA
jgi:antitoxin ParD1/3/4